MTVDTRLGSYPDSFAKYLRPTDLCDFDYGPVRKVANEISREASTVYQVITKAHEFVSGLKLTADQKPKQAQVIIREQQASCNQRASLFVTLLRCAGVPCRVHAFEVDKQAYKEVFSSAVYAVLPKKIVLLYPEVYYKNKWMLLSKALASRAKPDFSLCAFDDARARKTPVSTEHIIEDLGSFWHPDKVYEQISAGTFRSAALGLLQRLSI